MDPTQTAVTALEYVIVNVLGERPVRGINMYGPYRAACFYAGINDIIDFSIMEEDDWKEVEIQVKDFKTETGEYIGSPPKVTEVTDVTRRLNLVERRRLLYLRAWHEDFGTRNPGVPPINAWFRLDRDIFATWMTQYRSPVGSQRSAGGGSGQTVLPQQTSQPPVANTAASDAAKLLESFTRSIKRDQSDFKPLKEDKYWLSFKRSLLVTARSQNVERVFDLTFDRTTLVGPQVELYELQLKYGYSVLTKVIQTSQGKVYVRQHAQDGDATEVLRELTEYYTHSRVAEIAATETLTKVTSLRMDQRWATGAVAFLNYWRNLVADLEEIKGNGSVTTPAQKKDWLIASLSTNEAMTNAITTWKTMDRMMAHTTVITEEVLFSNLWAHLETTATDYDTTHKIIRSKQRSAHQGNRTRTQTGSARAGPSQNKVPSQPGYLDAEQWNKLTPEERRDHINKRRAATKKRMEAKKADVSKNDIKAEVLLALQAERQANAAILTLPTIEINKASSSTTQVPSAQPVLENSNPIFSLF